MRAASNEFKNLIARNSTLLVKAAIDFADGSIEELNGSDLFSMSFDEATSSSASFDIGATVIGQLSVSLNNTSGKFDEYDFTGAIVHPYVGKELSDGTVEWIKMGVYNVNQPDSYSSTIDLTCLDNLSKFEKAADVSSVIFPTTCNALLRRACSECDVDFPQAKFDGGDYEIEAEPELADCTWLTVLGYICQITCNFAKCDEDGGLVVKWYDTSTLETEGWLDDGTLDNGSPVYKSGDTADGGNFDNYGSGDSFDGGKFENEADFGIINAYSSLTLNTDDVVITGVRVTASDEADKDGSTGESGETVLEGRDGYVMIIEDNPLVLYGKAADVASMVGAKCVGMRFRPFDCDAISDPTIETGDAILLSGRGGNIYRSYCTGANLKVNGVERISCTAESASRNFAGVAGAATSVYVAARQNTKRKLSERDKAIARLGKDLENASGLYSTTKREDDGSYTYYLHDKRDLASSQIVYRVTADGIAISTDGGENYTTGLSANGDAILNRIYTIGLNADYITTGSLDAERINLSKAITIGPSHSYIEIGKNPVNGMSYHLGGNEAMTFDMTYCGVYNEVIYDSSGKILVHWSPSDTGELYTKKLSKKCIYYQGAPFVSLAFVASVYVNSQYVTVSSGWSDIMASTLVDAGGGVLQQVELGAGVYLRLSLTSDGYISVSVSKPLDTNSSGYLYSLSITYSTGSAGCSIDNADGSTFVTNQSFAKDMNNGLLFSGVLSFPFVFNNLQWNKKLEFKNGLLVSSWTEDYLTS